jgi:S1-C subfamily serine protease
LIIAGASGGALVLGAIGWLVVWSLASKPTEKAVQPDRWLPAKKGQPAVPAVQPQQAQKAPEPVNLPPRAVIPPGPAPDKIAQDTIAKVKKATVYLKVTQGNGQVSEGTGFFAIDPGMIVTNAHVLGMLSPASWSPRDVEIVINSGEPGQEVPLSAQVLGVDRDSDLAILAIKDEQRRWPAPLAVDVTGHLKELDKVYVFGFPYGTTLGKGITVSTSSISSIRKPDGKTVTNVQLQGGINRGNSGGPVVDTRGVVIGVAVSMIHGTQIDFAVPGDKVQDLLRGRVAHIAFGEPYRDGTNVKVPLEVLCVDPLDRIRGLQLQVWTGKPGVSRPASAKQPQADPSDGARQTISLEFKEGKARGEGSASAELSLPTWDRDKAIWVQPVLTDAGQSSYWDLAVSYQPSAFAPLERKPAALAYLPDVQPERTVKLSSTYEIKAVRGVQFSASHQLECEAQETASREPRGVAFRLQIAGLKATETANGEAKNDILEAEKHVRGQAFTVVTDPQGKLLDRTNPKLPKEPSKEIREQAQDLIERLANTYELTCLTLAPQQLQAGETWKTNLPWLVTSKGKKVMMGIFAVCTMEGIRVHDGQKQAQISLSGNLHDGSGNPVAGQISGKLHFSLDKGYITLAEIKIVAELDMGETLVTLTEDARLERSPASAAKK